jgi:hypothetical protein
MGEYICPEIVKAEFAYSRPFDKSANLRLPGYNVTFPDGTVEWVSKATFEKHFCKLAK